MNEDVGTIPTDLVIDFMEDAYSYLRSQHGDRWRSDGVDSIKMRADADNPPTLSLRCSPRDAVQVRAFLAGWLAGRDQGTRSSV